MKYTDLLSQVTEKLGGSFLLCNILSLHIKQLEKGAEPKIYRNISDSCHRSAVAPPHRHGL